MEQPQTMTQTTDTALKGKAYKKRIDDVNAIYDRYARSGVSNREIWKRFVYPVYGICERTFYSYLKRANV